MKNTISSFLGIDVSKQFLDVAVYPAGYTARFDNTPDGIDSLLTWAAPYAPELSVLEATGGLEIAVLTALYTARQPVARVNPRWVKDFGRALGIQLKTDARDALLLARYGQAMQPKIWNPAGSNAQALKALWARRIQLQAMIIMESNRIHQSSNDYVLAQQRHHTAFLENQLTELDRQLDELIQKDETARRKREIIESIPGVARSASMVLLAELPELGQINGKQIASLVGVAPFNNDSGTKRGYRSTGGGRAAVRKVMYMVTVGAATRNNPVLKNFYGRLVEKGKKPRVALIACLRKLLVIINAMIKNNTTWRQYIT